MGLQHAAGLQGIEKIAARDKDGRIERMQCRAERADDVQNATKSH
jgi:hypothetical protein